MIFNSDLYKKKSTMQYARELIYIDVARGILSSLNDATGISNSRSRLNGTQFNGDLNLLTSNLLGQIMNSSFMQDQLNMAN